jgi:hypothetical protein
MVRAWRHSKEPADMLTDYLDSSRTLDQDRFQAHIHTTGLNDEHDAALALDHTADDLQEPDSEASDEQFAITLLVALAAMAVRSKRRQADLAAALRRSGITSDAQHLSAALRHLEGIGCIEHLVPLYDGGVLMSVTSRGIEQLNGFPRWQMFGTPGDRAA